MKCPVCKCDMIVIEYRSIELDYCTECQGVWFDTGELELLLSSYHMKDIQSFLESLAGGTEARSKEKERKCPICGRGMKKTRIGGQPGVLIDICRQEHGLWFDGGEVIQLLGQITAGQTAATDSGDEVIRFMWEVFQSPE